MTPPVSPCGPLCGPMTGGAESLPLLAGSGRCGPVVGGVAAQGFRRTEGRKEKQDKAVSSPPPTPPRNAGRDKGLRDLTRLNLWLCERKRRLLGPSNKQKMPVLRGFPGHPLWI